MALNSDLTATGGTYVPISGLTGTDGNILALQGLVSLPDAFLPPTVPWSQFVSTSVQVLPTWASAELMASVGFKGLSLTGQANAVYWVLDVMATSTVPSNFAQSPVASWVFGVGLRVGIRGVGVTGNAALSLSNLAASATLNGTATFFEFDTVGIGVPIMPLLKGLVDQSLTGFDVSTLQEIGNVLDDLTEFIANPTNADALIPQVVGVIFTTTFNDYVQGAAATYGWALRGVQKGMTAQALTNTMPNNLPENVGLDAAIQANVYDDIVGSQTATPNSTEQSTAKTLTHSGP